MKYKHLYFEILTNYKWLFSHFRRTSIRIRTIIQYFGSGFFVPGVLGGELSSAGQLSSYSFINYINEE